MKIIANKLPGKIWIAFFLMFPFMCIAGNLFDNDGEIIRDYSKHLIVKTETTEDGQRLFQFQSISAETLIVKLTPHKYRPYLNEFDPLPDELFTKEGYDNYLEFKLNPGDIQWREFEISPTNIWKMNIEVRLSNEK